MTTDPVPSTARSVPRPAGAATTVVDERVVFDRLDREWQHLSGTRRHVGLARSWGLELVDVGSLDDVLERVGFGRARDDRDGDRLLAVLVGLARHDELAARIVLQRLVPGLRSMARRRRLGAGHGPGNRDHDDLPSIAWTVIRCYPIERHPDHVAAGLLQEIEYHTFRRPHRRATRFVPTPLEQLDRTAFDDDQVIDASLMVSVLVAQALAHGVDEGSLSLVRRLAAGVSASVIAAELQVTARTVRNRRDHVVRTLRTLPAAAW